MSQQSFCCVTCDYTSCSKKDYNKHLLTRKHKRLTSTDEKNPQQQTYTCQCGKIYKHRQSLHNHVVKCTHGASVDASKESNAIIDIHNSPAAIVELLRQNQEFKQLMIDQSKQIQETQSQLHKSFAQNTELQNQIIEWFKEGKASK